MGQTAAAIDQQLIPVGFDLSLNVDSLRFIMIFKYPIRLRRGASLPKLD